MRGRARRPATVSALVFACVLTAGAAGCSAPAGLDGDLVGAWQPMPEPTSWVPEAEVCHTHRYREAESLLDYHPVPCTEPHQGEAVHVGEFTGDAAERVTPPSPGIGVWRDAYRDCEDAATEYLGAHHHTARLRLQVTVPTESGWDGGARWFRCELRQLEEPRGDARVQAVAPREESLAGALAGDSPLRLGCFTVADADRAFETMTAVACDEPHQAQFAGLVRLSPERSYPDKEAQTGAYDAVREGCLERLAEYTDVSVDDLPYRLGFITTWQSEERWERGARSARCFLWHAEGEITGSLEGVGPDGLPVG